jgi:hypothetical protein
MIAWVPTGTRDTITEAQQEEFITTSTVHRRGHDKPHLEEG